jgi:hypothetical protein
VCGEECSTREQLRLHQRFSRADDTVSGHCGTTQCSVCGEGFTSAAALALHARQSEHKQQSNPDALSSVTNHCAGGDEGAAAATAKATCIVKTQEERFAEEEHDIKQHMLRTRVEIVVLVEGIDAPTSATVQARYSYCVSDTAWHHTFAPCVRENATARGGVTIDYDKLHDLVPVERNAAQAEPPSSH